VLLEGMVHLRRAACGRPVKTRAEAGRTGAVAILTPARERIKRPGGAAAPAAAAARPPCPAPRTMAQPVPGKGYFRDDVPQRGRAAPPGERSSAASLRAGLPLPGSGGLPRIRSPQTSGPHNACGMEPFPGPGEGDGGSLSGQWEAVTAKGPASASDFRSLRSHSEPQALEDGVWMNEDGVWMNNIVLHFTSNPCDSGLRLRCQSLQSYHVPGRSVKH
jgi:hypothetical protein